MNIRFVNLHSRYLNRKAEIDRAVLEVLAGGSYILGPNVAALEDEIASYIGCRYAVGVASGSDALLLSLLALKIGEGDEVITTAYTFFATAGAIVRAGAKPVFVDIDETTFNLDPGQLSAALTHRTRAIMPVHLFGQPTDLDSILQFAQRHRLAVIEDACQAMGAVYKGKKVGPLGHLGCFSFFPTKNLGAMGDGGIVVTNDNALAEKIKALRVHGSSTKYYHDFVGMNSRLDELQAAILRVNLRYLDEDNARRSKAAELYKSYLKHTSAIMPYCEPHNKHVYHLYVILHSHREKLLAFLHQHNIGCGVYYPLPLHLQKGLQYLNYQQGDLPVSEFVSQSSLALPMHSELTEQDVERVAAVIQKLDRVD